MLQLHIGFIDFRYHGPECTIVNVEQRINHGLTDTYWTSQALHRPSQEPCGRVCMRDY